MDSAKDILNRAVADIGDRASERDTEAEKSMPRAVKAFNAMFGKDLTTVQGWQFMELLKMARSVGGKVREDDYRDGAAYAALAGEEAIAEELYSDRTAKYSTDKLMPNVLREDIPEPLRPNEMDSGLHGSHDMVEKCHGKSCTCK